MRRFWRRMGRTKARRKSRPFAEALYIPYIHSNMNKPVHTRTFKSGNSVAVRLPKGFAIPEGTEVELDKSGDTVTIRIARDEGEERARMLRMLDDLAAMPKPPQVEKRQPISFPRRRGL